jgi:hypothetical protein
VKDLQAHLAQIRSDAAECILLATLTTDEKSEMFVKMAEHLNGLAVEIEKTIAGTGTGLLPEPTARNPGAADRHHPIARNATALDRQEIATSNVPAITVSVDETKKRRRIFALALIITASAGAFLWTNGYVDLAKNQIEQFLLPTIDQTKSDAQPQPPSSAKQGQREAISEQLKALGSRIEHLESELEKFKNAQSIRQTNDVSEETKPASEPPPSLSSEENPRPPAEDQTFTVQNPTKRPDSSITGAVGQTVVPAGELGGPKSGPLSCERFRSYDPTSKTYVTFDGHRRSCR